MNDSKIEYAVLWNNNPKPYMQGFGLELCESYAESCNEKYGEGSHIVVYRQIVEPSWEPYERVNNE